jgi:hypothetical protein
VPGALFEQKRSFLSLAQKAALPFKERPNRARFARACERSLALYKAVFLFHGNPKEVFSTFHVGGLTALNGASFRVLVER